MDTIWIYIYIYGLVFFSRGPRYVLVGGGALAKQTPKMKIIFEGLLMVVIWRSWAQIYQDGSQHLLRAAFRRPLRHPALHPRSLAALCSQVG